MTDTNVKFSNLPGMYTFKNDGNLVPEATSAAPRVVVVGTASQGTSEPYLVSTTSAAKVQFGTDGTLYRGIIEAIKGGAQEVLVFRIGATPALVTGIGDLASAANEGYNIETVLKDDTAGAAYSVFYDDTENRLVVFRVSDGVIVFDNDPDLPIDLFEVIVSGARASGGGADIGTASGGILLSAIINASFPGTAYTAGTDGVDISRMEVFEKLYLVYKELFSYSFDVLNPMDIYLDDYNTFDQGNIIGAVPPDTNGLAANSYPTAGSYLLGNGSSTGDVDSLGRVYIEEYQGEYFFWWSFARSGNTADIFPAADPTGGSQDLETLKLDGTALVEADFHEVNFAYQLGRFLYEYSTNIVESTGNIGVLPPNSNSLKDKARFSGKEPTLTTDNTTGITTVTTNGYGLLGNKFMQGRTDHRSAAPGGGFIVTDTEFLDGGTEILDGNDIPIDLGKFFNVIADWPLLSNNFNTAGYISSFAGSYGGFYSNLNPSSAPTNKVIPNGTIVYTLNVQTLDKLAGAGYVVLRQKPQGTVIADSPTAALSTSDWTRLSTVRIVKTVIDGMRAAGEPYLGELLPDSKKAALENALQNVLVDAKKAGLLKNYKSFVLIQTPDMAVQGKAYVALTLIPAFELRQIELTINLSKSA